MPRPIRLAALGLFLAAPATLARTWSVLPDGTGDAPTIQATIDSAMAGDAVGGSIGWDALTVLQDPCLCDPASCDEAPTTSGHHVVASDFPCLPANNACGLRMGAPIEPGQATSIEPASGTRIRSRYR